jgi:hypothetical protein
MNFYTTTSEFTLNSSKVQSSSVILQDFNNEAGFLNPSATNQY